MDEQERLVAYLQCNEVLRRDVNLVDYSGHARRLRCRGGVELRHCYTVSSSGVEGLVPAAIGKGVHRPNMLRGQTCRAH